MAGMEKHPLRHCSILALLRFPWTSGQVSQTPRGLFWEATRSSFSAPQVWTAPLPHGARAASVLPANTRGLPPAGHLAPGDPARGGRAPTPQTPEGAGAGTGIGANATLRFLTHPQCFPGRCPSCFSFTEEATEAQKKGQVAGPGLQPGVPDTSTCALSHCAGLLVAPTLVERGVPSMEPAVSGVLGAGRASPPGPS